MTIGTVGLVGATRAAMPICPPHDVAALKGLLAEGWQIEAPVLARLSWAQHRTGDLAYHFILARGGRRSLVVIADSPDVHTFLADLALPVVEPTATPEEGV
jgi:hypothetical protein